MSQGLLPEGSTTSFSLSSTSLDANPSIRKEYSLSLNVHEAKELHGLHLFFFYTILFYISNIQNHILFIFM